MTLKRILMVLLVVTTNSRADKSDRSPVKQLDPDRVRALLIADEDRKSKVKLRLDFRQKVLFQSTQNAQKHERAVRVKLNGTFHGGSSYELRTGGARTSLRIEHGDLRYRATRKPGKTWITSTNLRGTIRIRPVGLMGALRYPVLNKVTWAEFLQKYPVVEASIKKDELTLFFAVDSTTGGWIKKRSLDSIGGRIGWMCVLSKSGDRFRLTRVEAIVTTYRLVADGVEGGVKRVPHKDFLAERGRRRINGMNEFGVLRYTEFSQFKELAAFALPMKVIEGGTKSMMTAEIDPMTLKENVKFQDDDFAFQPPRSFGERGTHSDKK